MKPSVAVRPAYWAILMGPEMFRVDTSPVTMRHRKRTVSALLCQVSAIADPDAGALCGRTRCQFTDDDRLRRIPEREAEAVEQRAGLGQRATLPFWHDDLDAPGAAALVPHFDRHVAVCDQVIEYSEHRGLARPRGLAADAADLVQGAKIGSRGQRTRGDVADHRLQPGDPLHEHEPVRDDREQEIENRSREQHRDACQRRPAIESARQLLGWHRALALVEQAHVAAERNRRDHVFDAIRVAAGKGHERTAEADRESQHLEAEAAGDPVVPELVYR